MGRFCAELTSIGGKLFARFFQIRFRFRQRISFGWHGFSECNVVKWQTQQT
jgi:hypothetical protein